MCVFVRRRFPFSLYLERNPGLKQTEVASVLGIKRTNFVVLLDELERRGLAERRAAASDARAHSISPTKAQYWYANSSEWSLQ